MTKRSGSTATVTVSLPDSLVTTVREMAGHRGVSSFIGEAVEEHVRSVRLGELTAEIAANTGGPYTEDELAWAQRVLHGEQSVQDLAEAA